MKSSCSLHWSHWTPLLFFVDASSLNCVCVHRKCGRVQPLLWTRLKFLVNASRRVRGASTIFFGRVQGGNLCVIGTVGLRPYILLFFVIHMYSKHRSVWVYGCPRTVHTEVWVYGCPVTVHTEVWVYGCPVTAHTEVWVYGCPVTVHTEVWVYGCPRTVHTAVWVYGCPRTVHTAVWVYDCPIIVSTTVWKYVCLRTVHRYRCVGV